MVLFDNIRCYCEKRIDVAIFEEERRLSNGLVANLPVANCKEPMGPYPSGNTPPECCIEWFEPLSM